MKIVLSEGKFSISQPAFRCKYHISILVFIPLLLILLLQKQHLDTCDVFRLGLLAVNVDHRHHSIKYRSRKFGSETIITFLYDEAVHWFVILSHDQDVLGFILGPAIG